MSSMLCALIVLLFNLYWVITYGPNEYVEMYKGRVYPKWYMVFMWLYAAWGLYNLLHFIKIIK